jgi:hypothetical protein
VKIDELYIFILLRHNFARIILLGFYINTLVECGSVLVNIILITLNFELWQIKVTEEANPKED